MNGSIQFDISKDQTSRERSLSEFEKTVINSQLQECLSQIKLLSRISAGGRANQIKKFKSNNMGSIKSAIQPQVMLKLVDERVFIERTLASTKDELKKKHYNGNYLKSIIDLLSSRNKEQCEALRISIEQMRKNSVMFQKEINDILTDTDSQVKRKEIEASQLKDGLENASFQQEVEIKYTAKWEAARADQNLMIAKIEEARLAKMLRELQYQIDFEDRVHTEITIFLEQTTLKLEEDIKAWKEKYSEQMDHYEKQLLDIKQKRGMQLEKLNNLTKKYHDHSRKIKEYTFEKEERRRESELKEHLNKTTTKIQAWWRGVMVRRHLGPYKKKGKGKERPKFKGKAGEKAEQESKGKSIKK